MAKKHFPKFYIALWMTLLVALGAYYLFLAPRDSEESLKENRMLAGFPELLVDSVKIYRKGRMYSFLLHCRFQAGEAAVFPDVAQKMKEAVFAGMREQFGVENLRKIRIVLTELAGKNLPETENSASDTVPAVTPGMPVDQM